MTILTASILWYIIGLLAGILILYIDYHWMSNKIMLFDVVDVFIVGLYGPVILVTAMAWGISIYIGRITDGKTFDQIIILENKKKK